MIIEHTIATRMPQTRARVRASARNAAAVSGWNCERREKSLNWLAFGLLLAAWNFSDNDAVISRAGRPAELANHALVTVRAARGHAI